ncbi:sperm-associated antigen 5 [Anguilla rostrata]|uniref:sperm-associated antigen 5 n=1 Tax=Anguilla rostrata TaxID=7938 RepID=UPI0030D2BA6D
MAARRGFQANGDITPVMRPVERLPLRNLQNELHGQQLTLSATKLMSSKPALKKKGEPVQVEELPHCSSLHGTSIGKARLVDTELTKENGTVVVAVDDEPVLQKGCPDSLRAEVIDREMELQSRTSSSTVPVQLEHTEDITGRVLTERAGEGADTVDTQDQCASVGCLSDSSTSCVTQPATADSAVEHCTDNRIGDVTFKSFLCSGVELEIPDASVMTEETLLLLTQSAADVSSGCSFQNDLSGLLSFSQHLDLDSSNRHEDHAYCFPEKDDSCSRDELLPVGTSVTEPLELEDPPGGLDPTGQALMSSECLETMQDGSSSHLLQENSIWSSSALEHLTAMQSITADQSQDKTEKSVSADQTQDTAEKSLTADQSQDTAEASLTADQSQDTAEQSVTADQSQNTAEQSVTADQSQSTAEQSVTADQSQSTAEQSVTADQSQDTAEKSVTVDQSQNTSEKSLMVDQSQVTAEKSLMVDQSQDTAEKCLMVDQSQVTAEKSLMVDQLQDTAEKSLMVDQSQDTAEKSLGADQSHGTTESILGDDQSLATAEKSLPASQSQDKAEKSLSADQSQDKAARSLTADQSQNTAEKSVTADQSQIAVVPTLAGDQSQYITVQGLAAECKESETPSGLQRGISDVTAGHAQPRRPEGPSCFSPSCVETGSPAQARSSHLRKPGPGGPWDAADSPVGPRESRLWMGNLESPMPLPQLNSTLIQSILGSAIATPQTTKSNSRVLPPPAEGGAGPQPGPQQAPEHLTGTQTGHHQENLGPQTPEHLTGTQTGPHQENLGPQTPGHLTGTKLGPLQENLGLQALGDLAGTKLGPLQENLGLQALGDLAGTKLGPLQENLGPQELGDLAGAQSGPLQERLRQMGELLLRASQNLVPAVERHSASTCTSPVPVAEHGVNTSGLFERKREFTVAEASTSTDSLPWNLAPEAVAGYSRQDLEQRLFSMLIMVEALSQQLASARAHRGHAPPPSDLRDRLVQTDHTELSQGVVFRELYVKAQERIRALELEQEQQERLLQELRSSSSTMAALGAETEHALSSVNEMGKIASEDQVSISEQMHRMRTLYGRFREALRRTEERMRRCTQEKLLMEQQREEALRTKEASLAVLEQLQSRHAAQVAELEKSVGCHLELLPALSTTYQEQVSLNEGYVESLQAADELLKDTISDQSRIYEELSKAQFLLRRTGPVLLKLHQKAAAALQAHDLQTRDADRMRDELEQTTSCLQDAQQEIGDLNLQVTILTSEMAVLRQRLSELEEDVQGRLRARARHAELTASTFCAVRSGDCAVLCCDPAVRLLPRLEEVQGESSRRLEELGGALAERDVQLAQTQRCLHELQTQLSSTRVNELFLQMESEVSREQVVQSEALVKSHLQGLRERNLECEDLRQELRALRLQRDTLQEEVFSTQENARSLLLDMGNQLALASTDIILLHHKVYTLTSALNTTLSTQKPDSSYKDTAPPSLAAPPRHSARSFVDSIMVAATTEEAQASETDECPSAALGSGNSAFTRIPTTTPKKCVEEGSEVPQLLGGLGDAVSQLVCTVDRVRELRDRQCEELQHTVSRLQGELDSQAAVYGSQVADLRGQVAHLQAQVEKDAVDLQQKAQEEKTLRKLCSDLDESRELHQQQKSENKELRRELSALRSALQQAQVEAQFLKEELSGGQSAGRLPALEEKVRLQKEVDKLRKSLSETEDSRSKLLERAKRHQLVLEANQRSLERELHILDQTLETVKRTLSSIPEVVKDCEQLQKLVTYLG